MNYFIFTWKKIDSDNDSDIDNKDVLDHEKINEYKKRKLSSTNLRNHI